MTAVLGTFGFLALGIVTWQNRLGPLAKDHLPPAFIIPATIAGTGLVMFPIWFRAYLHLPNGHPRNAATFTPFGRASTITQMIEERDSAP
jgi:hypothetical protein